jgi:hypothetical protein
MLVKLVPVSTAGLLCEPTPEAFAAAMREILDRYAERRESGRQRQRQTHRVSDSNSDSYSDRDRDRDRDR